jgi:hypothetical protein
MRAIELFLAGAIGLSLAVIIFRDGGAGANRILQGLASFNATTFRVLQGR